MPSSYDKRTDSCLTLFFSPPKPSRPLLYIFPFFLSCLLACIQLGIFCCRKKEIFIITKKSTGWVLYSGKEERCERCSASVYIQFGKNRGFSLMPACLPLEYLKSSQKRFNNKKILMFPVVFPFRSYRVYEQLWDLEFLVYSRMMLGRKLFVRSLAWFVSRSLYLSSLLLCAPAFYLCNIKREELY